MKRISIQTSDKNFYTDFNNQKFVGLKISVFTKDSGEKEITDALTYIVTFGAGIAANVFSNWLYDKIKKNPDNKIVIWHARYGGCANSLDFASCADIKNRIIDWRIYKI